MTTTSHAWPARWLTRTRATHRSAAVPQHPAAAPGLICPACHGALQTTPGAMLCATCATSYPSVQGVPMLLPGLAVTPGPAPDPGFLDDLCRVALPTAPDLPRDGLRDLFSRRFTFPDPQLGIEGYRFVHRLRASGFTIREPGTPAPEPPPPPSRDPLTLHLVCAPAAVRAGQAFWVQLRITNGGPTVLPATGPGALVFSYTSQSARWRRRHPGHQQTPLLVDLKPGHALTQPVLIQAPENAGLLTYRLTPSLRAQRSNPEPPGPVTHPDHLRITIRSIASSNPDPLASHWPYDPVVRDYGDDHTHAIALLRDWLGARFPTARPLHVLELGGNSAPMLAKLDFPLPPSARRYNADIDPFGLVFGTLQRRHGGGHPIQDVLADGTRLPFANASLDVIVMFATLHHFPDPVRLLQHLATKLAPGGLICVCCEPVGHVSSSTLPPGFRDELLHGICEQAFEPWEWSALFTRAGLRPVNVQHDRGSLKVTLEPA